MGIIFFVYHQWYINEYLFLFCRDRLQKKLNSYIKGKKDFSFLKKNKSPFYNIKTGKVSGYNEIGQVMFKTLQEGHDNINERFKKNIKKNFGPGSIYWKNLGLR